MFNDAVSRLMPIVASAADFLQLALPCAGILTGNQKIIVSFMAQGNS
jgi:hypothetical protein